MVRTYRYAITKREMRGNGSGARTVGRWGGRAGVMTMSLAPSMDNTRVNDRTMSYALCPILCALHATLVPCGLDARGMRRRKVLQARW